MNKILIRIQGYCTYLDLIFQSVNDPNPLIH